MGVLFIIIAVVLLIISANLFDNLYNGVPCFFIAIGLLIFTFICGYQTLSIPVVQYQVESYEIYAIKDKDFEKRNIFCVTTEDRIVFVKEYKDGMKIDNVDFDHSYIKESNTEKPSVTLYQEKYQERNWQDYVAGWVWHRSFIHYEYRFIVPVDSVVQEFNINLE